MTKARRPNLYVINGLRRKYGVAKGQIAANPGSNQLAVDLDHLAAVLAMFDPEIDLASIPVVRPYKPNREHWSRTALQILRTSDRPLRAWELARMVMAAQGVDPSDRKRLVTIACSLQIVLGRMADQGLVTVAEKPRRWAVAP